MPEKEQGMSLNTIIVAAIALVVLVILIAVFTGRIGFTKTEFPCIIGWKNDTHFCNEFHMYERIYVEEIDCGLITVWEENKTNCTIEYCAKVCWEPYGLQPYTSISNSYDFNNDSKIDPQERFIYDQNFERAIECDKTCRRSPYGCFDYVMDNRCETDIAVDLINISTGEISKWTSEGYKSVEEYSVWIEED